MNFKPHAYQNEAIKRLLDNERYALLLDMGLGRKDHNHPDGD